MFTAIILYCTKEEIAYNLKIFQVTIVAHAKAIIAGLPPWQALARLASSTWLLSCALLTFQYASISTFFFRQNAAAMAGGQAYKCVMCTFQLRSKE